MDEQQLKELLDDIVGKPEVWQPLVHHDPLERHSVSLYADDDVGVWVISWMPGQDTGFHDHAGSAGVVAVVQGDVCEERPEWAERAGEIAVTVNGAFSFGDADVHRVYAAGEEPAVTIHAYSPPLHGMGVYSVDADGTVHRTVVRWDHSLHAG